MGRLRSGYSQRSSAHYLFDEKHSLWDPIISCGEGSGSKLQETVESSCSYISLLSPKHPSKDKPRAQMNSRENPFVVCRVALFVENLLPGCNEK